MKDTLVSPDRFHRLAPSLAVSTAFAADPALQNHQVPGPEDGLLEVGGMDWMPDGRLAVCTRRGEVWTLSAASGSSTPAVCRKPSASRTASNNDLSSCSGPN